MMPFDRLVQAMDEWAAAHPDVPVEIQIGRGKYEPRHAKFVRLMPVAEYRQRVADARLFVAHAGMGSIISAIEAGKPLLMLPRLQAQGEHNTDHQLATAASIGARPGPACRQRCRRSARRAPPRCSPIRAHRRRRSRALPIPTFTARIRAFIEAP